MEYPRWRIGHLHHPAEDDPYFEYRDDAEDKAVELADWESIYGVWEYHSQGDADLIAIAFYQKIWKS